MPLFSSCGAERGARPLAPGAVACCQAASPRPCLPLYTKWRQLAPPRLSARPPTASPGPWTEMPTASPSHSSPFLAGPACAARRWPGWHCGPAGKSVPLPASGRCRALPQRHTSWGHSGMEGKVVGTPPHIHVRGRALLYPRPSWEQAGLSSGGLTT